MSEKNNKSQNRTKAGMLRDADENESTQNKAETEKDSENAPKISKEKAAERDHERPLH